MVLADPGPARRGRRSTAAARRRRRAAGAAGPGRGCRRGRGRSSRVLLDAFGVDADAAGRHRAPRPMALAGRPALHPLPGAPRRRAGGRRAPGDVRRRELPVVDRDRELGARPRPRPAGHGAPRCADALAAGSEWRTSACSPTTRSRAGCTRRRVRAARRAVPGPAADRMTAAPADEHARAIAGGDRRAAASRPAARPRSPSAGRRSSSIGGRASSAGLRRSRPRPSARRPIGGCSGRTAGSRRPRAPATRPLRPPRAVDRGPAGRDPGPPRRGLVRDLARAPPDRSAALGATPAHGSSAERAGPFGPERLLARRPARRPASPRRGGRYHRAMTDTATITSAPPTADRRRGDRRAVHRRGLPGRPERHRRAARAGSRRPTRRSSWPSTTARSSGFIAVHAMPRFEHDDRIVRILALVVDAGARERGVGRALMAEAERIGARARRGVHRDHRRPPSSRGPPPVRVARLRRDGDGLPAQEALTEPTPDPAGRPAGVPAAPRCATAAGATCSTCPGSGRSPTGPSDDAATLPRAAGRPVAPPRPVPRRRRPDLRPQGGAARRRRPPSSRSCATSRRRACRRSRAVGLAEAPERDAAILVTEYLGLLDPVPPPADALPARARAVPRPAARRDGLAPRRPPSGRACSGATARWPTPCSGATATRSRPSSWTPRRARSIPALSDGQRAYDLDILVENVALRPGRPRGDAGPRRTPPTTPSRPPRPCATRYARGVGRAPPRARAVARRPARRPGPDPAPQRPRLRGRRDHPRADRRRRRVRPAPGGGRQPPVPRPRAGAADRARRPRGPGPAAAQRPARVPGLARASRAARPIATEEAAERWLRDVLAAEPGARSSPAIGPERDPLQAYCDVLEEKWILSELAGRDVGLAAAIDGVPRRSARRRPKPTPDRRRRDRARHRLVGRLRRRSTASSTPTRGPSGLPARTAVTMRRMHTARGPSRRSRSSASAG